MSPRQYRLFLLLPALGFFGGALLFCLSVASGANAVLFMPAIGIALVSWVILVAVSLSAKCPDCGKSYFARVIAWQSRPLFFPKTWSAPWPERHCSRCGLEVGAGRD